MITAYPSHPYPFLTSPYSQSNTSCVTCPSHGPVPLNRLTPDLLFHDLPSHMVIKGSDVTLGRLLGKGKNPFQWERGIMIICQIS